MTESQVVGGARSHKPIRHALILVALRAILLFVVGIGVVGGRVLGDEPFNRGWRSVAFVAILLGGFDFGLVFGVGILKLGKTSLRSLGWKVDDLARDVGRGLLGFFGAAMVEETLFRGYLQAALTKRYGLVAAIVLQALLFDLMHMNFRPASLAVKLAFGLIFGLLRGRDRSLIGPAIAHGLIWAIIGAP